MRDTLKGILIGVLCALLIQAPIYLLGQGQDIISGRLWQANWNLPAGGIFFVASGGCPVGSTENADLSGKAIIGTVAANMNVGTTGGADTITPTVATLTAAAQTFSGSSANTSAVSAGTPAGTNGTAAYTPAGTNGTVTGPAQVISWPVGVPTNASGAFTEGAISWPAGVPTNGTVTGPAQVITWPAGVPTISGTTINSFSSVINHTHTITVTSLVQGGTTVATTGTHLMTSTATGGSARAPTSGDSFTATSANPAGGVASITPTINAPGAIAWPAGVPTEAAGNFTQPTISWPGGVPTNATSTIPAETFTGSALGTHTHTLTATGTNASSAVSGSSGATSAGTPAGTVAWPAGVPTNSAPDFTGSALGTHTHTLTPAGTINAQNFAGTPGTVPAEAFSGTQFDNRSAFVKVIYCQRT
jgi:hypothetical protein